MNIHRALITPQNTFLENVTAHLQGCPFMLGSARIADYPIVYASEAFAELTGYGRSEALQRSCTLSFMWSERCSPDSTQRLQRGFDSREAFQTELALYRKNRTSIWVQFKMTPIQNERNVSVLFLCVLQDITAQKQPLSEDGSLAGLSKFARLVRQVARNKPPPAAPKQNYSLMLAGASVEKSAPATPDGEWEQTTPRYIHEAPKAAPHILLHYSPFKATWDWLILLLTLYTAVVVPYYLAFRTRTLDDVAVIVLNGMVDVIFFVDVMLNFHTTYVGKAGDVVSDPKVIRLTYLRTWCAVDILSCLPYDLFNAVQYWTTASSSAVNALKVLRLLRLVRVARKLDHYIEYGAALLVLILVIFVVIGHWFACVWYFIGTSEVADRRYNWLNSLANLTGNYYSWKNGSSGADGSSSSQTLVGGPSVGSAYVTALYFTLSCMTSVGFGNVSATTDFEKLFACFMMIAGALLYASIFGNVTAIMQQFVSTSSKYRDMMNGVKKFAKLYQVPGELSERISDYVVSLWVVTKGIDQEKILNNCPKDIKADICIHLHQKVLKEHPGFRLASEGCLRAMALHFTMTHIAPGDILYHQGESVEQLCFVISGSLEVVQDDEVVAILSNGDSFGDDFWNHPTVAQSAASVRALTYCSIHCIKRDKLMEVLDFYQAFSNAFRRNMVITFPLRNRLIFRKIEDILRQKELEEKFKNEPKMELPDNQFVRKFLSKLAKSVHSVQDPEGTPKSVASYAAPSEPSVTDGAGAGEPTPEAAAAASGQASAAAPSGRVESAWGRLKFGPAQRRAAGPAAATASDAQTPPAAAVTAAASAKPLAADGVGQQSGGGGGSAFGTLVKSQHSPQPPRARRQQLGAVREVDSSDSYVTDFKASVLAELTDVRGRLASIEKHMSALLDAAPCGETDSLCSTPAHAATPAAAAAAAAAALAQWEGGGDGRRTPGDGQRDGGERRSSKWQAMGRKRSPKVHPSDRSGAEPPPQGDEAADDAAAAAAAAAGDGHLRRPSGGSAAASVTEKSRWNGADLDLL